jgi:hypothetical protein
LSPFISSPWTVLKSGAAPNAVWLSQFTLAQNQVIRLTEAYGRLPMKRYVPANLTGVIAAILFLGVSQFSEFLALKRIINNKMFVNVAGALASYEVTYPSLGP